MSGVPTSAEAFEQHRGLLFTVAYEMLGSVADAEDVLQESWLRWDALDPDEVRDTRAYLVRVVTRQALNRLRTVKRQRETYVGPWLPEPLATSHDVAEDVELAESVSVAMLVVLETLAPLERAVFVLHDVFGFGYDEIATATDRSVEACRQIASRARHHVHARRPRAEAVPDQAAVVERFLQASLTGDVQGLLDLMAPDVVLVSDGGGRKKAALRPITGPDKVARFLAAVTPDDAEIAATWTHANGQPALLLRLDGELDSLVWFVVAEGRVREIYLVRNPDKLGHVAAPVGLRRG